MGMKSCLVALLFACLAVVVGCNDSDSGASYDCGNNDKGVIACMGDSITGEVNNGVPPYPSVLATLIPSKTIVNQGLGGEHSSGGAARVNGVLSRYHPCYLLVLYGANDILHFYDLNYTISNLRYILQTAKNNGTIPIIATLTPMIYSHAVFQGSVDQLNVMIRQMASEEKVQLVDLANEFRGSEDQLISFDGLHPNANGVSVVAMAFYEKVKP